MDISMDLSMDIHIHGNPESQTTRDRGLLSMDHLQETTHCGSYVHATYDVTCP